MGGAICEPPPLCQIPVFMTPSHVLHLTVATALIATWLFAPRFQSASPKPHRGFCVARSDHRKNSFFSVNLALFRHHVADVPRLPRADADLTGTFRLNFASIKMALEAFAWSSFSSTAANSHENLRRHANQPWACARRTNGFMDY